MLASALAIAEDGHRFGPVGSQQIVQMNRAGGKENGCLVAGRVEKLIEPTFQHHPRRQMDASRLRAIHLRPQGVGEILDRQGVLLDRENFVIGGLIPRIRRQLRQHVLARP